MPDRCTGGSQHLGKTGGLVAVHQLGPVARGRGEPRQALAGGQPRVLREQSALQQAIGLCWLPSSMVSDGQSFAIRLEDGRLAQGQVHRQAARQIGVRFVENSGYIEWAQSNRLIVLFPQVVPRYGWTGGLAWVFNPRGCWDWWGYTDSEYATRSGRQIKAIQAMIERLGEASASVKESS